MCIIDFLKFNNCIAWILFPNTTNVITNQLSVDDRIGGSYLLENGTKARYFNGASRIILPEYILGQTFSISVCFNCTAYPIVSNTIYSVYRADQTPAVVLENIDNVLTFKCINGINVVKLEYPINTNQWYNVVAIHTSEGAALYINGVCVGVDNTPLALNIGSGSFSIIGCDDNYKYFIGHIKNFMLFNSFLFKNVINKLCYLTYINDVAIELPSTIVPDQSIIDVYVPEESILDPIPVIAPVAEFTADLLSGYSPLTVTFTDQSTNDPTQWAWYFGSDPTPVIVQNPVYIFDTAGSYNVTLISTNSAGSDTIIKSSYITVIEQPVPDPDPVVLYSTDDITLWEDDPDDYNDAGAWVVVSAGDGGALEFNGCIQFNTQFVSLPVTRATLRLHHNYYEWNGGYPGYITIKRLTEAFDEYAATWSNPPASTVVGSFNYLVPDPAGWVEIDVTDMVNASNGLTFGVMLDMYDTWLQAHFSSKEGPYQPELVVIP